MEIKGFHWTAKACYAISLEDKSDMSITFGVYDTNGGCYAEMQMRWVKLDKEDEYPRLECYADSFKELYEFGNIFKNLFDKKDFTQEEFVKVLLDNGFTDLTRYEM